MKQSLNIETSSRSAQTLASLWRIFRTVVFVMAFAAIGFCFFLILREIQQQGLPSYALVVFVAILSLLSIILMAYSINNDRFAKAMVSLALLPLILISVAGFDFKEVQLIATALLAFTALAFMVFNQLPRFGFIALSATFLFCLFHHFIIGSSNQWIARGHSLMSNYDFFAMLMRFLFNPIILLVFTPLLVACAFMPRMVNWGDWVWPSYRIRPKARVKNAENGFTLIELLIVIAIFSILFGTTFSSWTENIITHKHIIDRTQIHAILQSEMTALVEMDDLPPPSDEQHTLPMALQEFGLVRLEGFYTVSKTNSDRLVELEVHLVQYGDLPNETHFRLVSQKRLEAAP